MGTLNGKVAFITGAARGQGRSHAVMMAEEGADIIALDLCAQMESVEYPMATPEDLEETVRLVKDKGRRIVAVQADVRDFDAVESVVRQGMQELGRLDFVVANAGVMAGGNGRRGFNDTVDVLLTGVFHTCEAAIPALIEQGQGGAIVITSSAAGLKALSSDRTFGGPGLVGYTAAKHAVVGLMRVYAKTLATYSIRCNTVHPTGVNTPMVVHDNFWELIAANGVPEPLANPMPVTLVEPSDISNAIIYLCSDKGRYITGVTLPVDAGYGVK